MSYFSTLLTELKFYRRLKRGTWYRVVNPDDEMGLSGAISYWRQVIPQGWTVLTTETYP